MLVVIIESGVVYFALLVSKSISAYALACSLTALGSDLVRRHHLVGSRFISNNAHSQVLHNPSDRELTSPIALNLFTSKRLVQAMHPTLVVLLVIMRCSVFDRSSDSTFISMHFAAFDDSEVLPRAVEPRSKHEV